MDAAIAVSRPVAFSIPCMCRGFLPSATLGTVFANSLAARQGLEPQYSGPKPDVLPLDDRAMDVVCHFILFLLCHFILGHIDDGKFEWEVWEDSVGRCFVCFEKRAEGFGRDVRHFF